MSKIKFPFSHKEVKLQENSGSFPILTKFLEKENILRTILFINGTHVPIKHPRANAGVYYKRNIFYSMNFLCVVDIFLKFRHISFRFSSFHDSKIFRNSNLTSYFEYLGSLRLHVVGNSAWICFVGLKTIIIADSSDLDDEVSKQRKLLKNIFSIFTENLKALYIELPTAKLITIFTYLCGMLHF